MARKPRVIIAGGGIGGLATALALQNAGAEYEVFEQASRISEIGAGLNLSPNALKAFRMLGVEDESIAAGWEDEFQATRSWRTGFPISVQPRRVTGTIYAASYLTRHRADLQSILLKRLDASRVHTGKSVVDAGSDANGAWLRFADGTSADGDIALGADGIHSAVRDSLFGKSPPRFTGCVCWRGVVPVEAVANIPYVKDLAAWWGPHGHVVHYRVRRGELVNFVAHYDSDAWTNESWTTECTKDELISTFARWNSALLRLFELSERYYKWALYDRDPLPQWSKGRVTLAGDSAHPMLPYLGQGAASAVEDGCVLARLVAQGGEIESMLQHYEALRKPRTTRMQLVSRERAKENHLTSPAARLMRDAKVAFRSRFGSDKSIFKAGWVYEYDVGKVGLG